MPQAYALVASRSYICFLILSIYLYLYIHIYIRMPARMCLHSDVCNCYVLELVPDNTLHCVGALWAYSLKLPSWKNAPCNAKNVQIKHAKKNAHDKCRENAGAKARIAFFSHFSCMFLVFCMFLRNHVVQLVPGLIGIFVACCLHLFRFMFGFFFPLAFVFFLKSSLSSCPWSDWHFACICFVFRFFFSACFYFSLVVCNFLPRSCLSSWSLVWCSFCCLFSQFLIFVFFRVAFFNYFSAIVIFCISRICIVLFFLCGIFNFFIDVNILEQAQFDSTNSASPRRSFCALQEGNVEFEPGKMYEAADGSNPP